jgi:hypothetical protein
MIVTVVVPAIVVVSHEIKEETFCFHGSLAILTLDSSDRSGYGTLDEVQTSVREIIGPRHWRSG